MDPLVLTRIRHCQHKVEHLQKELSNREQTFQNKLTKLHKEHNDMVFRMEQQISQYVDEISCLTLQSE